MSVSMIVLKPIEGFQYADVLHSVQQASSRAGIHCIHVNTCFTRTCGFSIERPTDTSYDSFTWLVQKKNYFWAFDLQYLSGDFNFAFQFCAQYFNLEENSRDYLWIDDTEWVYSAEDMIWLSRQLYRPEWSYQKLTEEKT